MINLLPTGTCFEDAAGFLFLAYVLPLEKVKGHDIGDQIFVSHGILTEVEGHRISHAWLENDKKNLVIDAKFLGAEKIAVEHIKPIFYAQRKIIDVTRYNLTEFALMQILYGHCGPFEERYHNLCKGASEVPFTGARSEVGWFVDEMRKHAGDMEKIRALIARDQKEKITGIDWKKGRHQRIVR